MGGWDYVMLIDDTLEIAAHAGRISEESIVAISQGLTGED